MKKIFMIALILLTVYAVFGAEIMLKDGRAYKGDIISSQENRVVLQDNGVVIQIPAEKIESVIEDGQNVTDAILGKAALGQATDIHFIEDDDFFVCDAPLGTNTSVGVKTAKMINPPTQSSKMQAQFMIMGDGTQVWTKDYYTTKVGRAATVKPGQLIICFEGKGENDIYKGPQTDEEKRTGTWILSKVAATSNINDGYITLINGFKVDIENIRVIAK